MLAAASNLLALIAFTVHSVFGCCVHHHHDSFEHAFVTEHSNKSCCHEHACAKQDIAVEHNDRSCQHEKQSTSDLNNNTAAPLDGSNDCGEPNCHLISASTFSLIDLESYSSIDFCFCNSITLSLEYILSESEAPRFFRAAGPPATSSMRCAMSQSWQI